MSGDQPELLSAFKKDLSPRVTSSLRPQDLVSIYALDCGLLRTSFNAPPDPAILQRGVDLALSSPLPHGAAGGPSCAKSVLLRGSILLITRKLAELPGRRILLIVTSGRDGKSAITWPQLIDETGRSSVTIFAITTPGFTEARRIEDVYSLTQRSGGLLFSPTPDMLPNTLNRIISLLRSRYILQFSMPPAAAPTVYRVFVTVPKFDAITFPSGIGVPMPNPILDHSSTDLPSEAPEPPSPLNATPNR